VGLAVVLGAGSLALSACGGSGPAAAPATHADGGAGHVIAIQNYAYAPSRLTVAPGTRITVENRDSATHTLTSTQHRFDTGDLSPGSSAVITAPRTPGTYPYRCTIHPFMTGTLVVSPPS
jgi:plastocyanin